MLTTTHVTEKNFFNIHVIASKKLADCSGTHEKINISAAHAISSLRDTNVASKVQLYGIPSYFCPGKSLTFDFYAS